VKDAAVITGFGTVGSFGAGHEGLAAALRSGIAPTALLPDPAGYRRPDAVTHAGL
jgi:hypothetical protein